MNETEFIKAAKKGLAAHFAKAEKHHLTKAAHHETMHKAHGDMHEACKAMGEHHGTKSEKAEGDSGEEHKAAKSFHKAAGQFHKAAAAHHEAIHKCHKAMAEHCADCSKEFTEGDKGEKVAATTGDLAKTDTPVVSTTVASTEISADVNKSLAAIEARFESMQKALDTKLEEIGKTAAPIPDGLTLVPRVQKSAMSNDDTGI